MKKILLLIMALSLMLTLGIVTAFAEETSVETTQFVAEMNGEQYETLAQAVSKVPQNNEPYTITLLRNAQGLGIDVKEKQNIVFEFNTYTYNAVDDPLAGSTGTQSQALRVQQGATVTLRNGTLYSEIARMLLNNYGALILDDFTLDGRKLALDEGAYTLSNNCGSVVVKNNSNIYAKKNGFAFDLWYGMYPVYYSGVTVRFDKSFEGTVDGNIEYGAKTATENWIDRTALIIDGNGKFNSEFKISANLDDIKNANITVLGGTFTGDVSEFIKDADNLVEDEPIIINGNEVKAETVCYHKLKIDVDCFDKTPFIKSIIVSCEKCGKKFLSIGEHDHSFVLEKTLIVASCTQEGCVVNKCDCGLTEVVTTNKLSHTPGTSVKENEIAATCYSKGSYDAVVYCSVCECEISRTKNTVETLEHTPDKAVTENKIDSTCYSVGSYDSVVYCSVEDCKAEISRTPKTIKTKAHTPAAAVKENKKAATCTSDGSYDSVVYCSVEKCKAEISREAIKIDMLGHSWNDTTYTFAADGSACTAERVCKRNANHKDTATAKITSKVTTAATCERKGKTTYTATFTEDWATTQTKVLADVKALGHDYEVAVTKKATCIAEGVKTYTCNNDKSHTKTEKIAIDKNAHNWSATGPECTICDVPDEIKSVEKAYYSTTEYTVGETWKNNATLTFIAVFKEHTAKVSFAVAAPDGLDMTIPGKYPVKSKYKGMVPEESAVITIYPANTTSFTASAQTTTTVTLKWAKAIGASGYRVFYKVGSSWKTINETTALSYKVRGLKAGTKYTFAVRPFYDTGSEKLFSEDYPTIATATCTATPELTSTRASSTKGKAYVYHTDVLGETGYTVYYSTSSTTGFKKYNNFKADTTSAAITGLTAGKTYYFKVRTYIKTSSGYVYSPWSAVKGVKVV